MITSELLDYIRSSLAAGTDTETIKNELRTTGWIDSDIEAAFASVTSPHAPATTHGWHVGRREVIMALAGLLLLAGGASGYYFYIPAKPLKIVSTAWKNMENITTFDYSGRLGVEVTDAVETLSLDKILGGKVAGANSEKFIIDFLGSADVTNEELPKARTLMTFTYSPFTLELEMIQIDSNIYFKVGDLPALGDTELSKYLNQWIKVDEEFLEKYDDEDLNEEMNTEHDRRIADLFDNSHLFNGLERSTDDIVDGQKMHHFIYKVDQQGWRDFFRNVAEITNVPYEEYSGFNFSDGEIWIGKKDNMVHKITGTVMMSAQEDLPSGSMEWEFGLRNFNKPTTVTAPTMFKDIEEIVKEFEQSMKLPVFSTVEN